MITFRLLLSAPRAVLKMHPAPSRPMISIASISCIFRYLNSFGLEKASPRHLLKTMSLLYSLLSLSYVLNYSISNK